ncbi:MAG: hypothetical protein C0423_14610 [Methylibium sp.]|nr:hypothetical protein [Methylibium sp.]
MPSLRTTPPCPAASPPQRTAPAGADDANFSVAGEEDPGAAQGTPRPGPHRPLSAADALA